MKETKIFLVALGVLAVALLGFNYFNAKDETPPTTVRVSGNFKENILFNSIIDIADEQGYFKKNKVQVEKVDTVAGTTLLGTHEIDAAILVSSSPANLFLNNKDVKIIGTLNNYIPAFHIVSRLPEDKLVETKKVGVNKIGNADHLSAVLIAEKLGINDPEYILAPDDTAKTALLEKGEIDFAFIISQSALDNLKAKGTYTIIKPEDAFKGIALPLSLISTETALNEKPEAMKGFVKAIYSSIKYDKNNKSKMILFLENKYNVTNENAQYLYERNQLSRKDFNYVPTEEAYKDVLALIGQFVKVTNPDRKVGDFIYQNYAKEATR